MSTQDTIKKTTSFIRNSATLKIFSIGIIVLFLLIPTSMINSLMWERQSRRNEVVQEINQKWGNRQILTGPFFTVPYRSYFRDKNDALKFNIEYLHILPEKLDIGGDLKPHIRYRSLYEAVLYNTNLKVSGNFVIPALGQLDIDPANVLWEKAIFSMGISDMRGIRENILVNYNGTHHKAEPGLKTTHIAAAGVKCAIPLSPDNEKNAFSFELSLNGSEEIGFIPVAETTHVGLKSDWPSPSFNGSFLPASRDVTKAGFSANWKVLHLNRNFPQYWTGNQYNVTDSAFGTRLLITADVYQKAIRISKYAVMFIVFTFAAFFFSEIINRNRVHPIQYILIGMAVILFYVLLLSISEHVDFDFAYIISASAITLLISGYSKGILKNNRFTVTVFGILTILYAYLYIVLQLEDYALLMGSIGLLLILTTVMYITRKIDWYAVDGGKEPADR